MTARKECPNCRQPTEGSVTSHGFRWTLCQPCLDEHQRAVDEIRAKWKAMIEADGGGVVDGRVH